MVKETKVQGTKSKENKAGQNKAAEELFGDRAEIQRQHRVCKRRHYHGRQLAAGVGVFADKHSSEHEFLAECRYRGICHDYIQKHRVVPRYSRRDRSVEQCISGGIAHRFEMYQPYKRRSEDHRKQ